MASSPLIFIFRVTASYALPSYELLPVSRPAPFPSYRSRFPPNPDPEPKSPATPASQAVHSRPRVIRDGGEEVAVR